MHHALRIQEILSNIFGHRAPGEIEDYDLVSLARTCRAFKDPALDALWKELEDLHPLVQILPQELSMKQLPTERWLTQTKWGILQSYTRRVRSILDFSYNELDPDSLRILLLNSPIAEPLFPNLISVTLYDDFGIPVWLQYALKFLPKFAPHIRNFCIEEVEDHPSSTFACDCICRFQNLQRVECLTTFLDIDTLIHLSRMPALTKLHFSLSAIALPASFLLLSFSNLHRLAFRSNSWSLISQLLSWIQLPVIRDFITCVINCPSRQEFSSLWASVETSICRHTIENFVISSLPSSLSAPPVLLLSVEDLRPCMAFSNLRHISLNIAWKMGIKDEDLLELASAWPRLECLTINPYSGWCAPDGGISPDGLLRLLKTCRSLSEIALVLDTRGYVEVPASGSAVSLGRAVSELEVDVLDSVIEAESVPAVVAFFTGIAPPTDFTLVAGEVMVSPRSSAYQDRWAEVSRRVRDAVAGCS